MSKIKNVGLDQYGAEPFEQQQFETAGVEGVKLVTHRLTDSDGSCVVGFSCFNLLDSVGIKFCIFAFS